MFFRKNVFKLLILSTVLGGMVAYLRATYYQPDFFPIGLTGLNKTDWPPDNCPYGTKGWKWTPEDNEDQNEQSLIFSLGVNCIGCSDAYPGYLVDLKPASDPSPDNYLHKVCAPSPDSNKVYLIPHSLRTDSIICHGCARVYDANNDKYVTTSPSPSDSALYPWQGGNRVIDTIIVNDTTWRDTLISTDPVLAFRSSPSKSTIPDSLHKRYAVASASNKRIVTLFRSWNRSGFAGFGPDEFKDGPYDYQGASYYGDSHWHDMMDPAITNLETHFQLNGGNDSLFWGWNLLVEDPAAYRGTGARYVAPDPHKGAWGAVNRVIKGDSASHDGFRGVDNTLIDGGRRMIVLKGQTYPFHMANINIFADVPEVDAFLVYGAPWNAKYNYGEQGIMDNYLYGADSEAHFDYTGYHNTAIYFQQYGQTNLVLGVSQERRWMACLSLEWKIDKNNLDEAISRRPCPPEIRCAAYLALSRGAKGIFFHPWLNSYGSTPSLDPSQIDIPVDNSSMKYYNLGLRDKYGYPFGEGGSGSGTHKLNSGGTSTYWHVNNDDYTYDYLAEELIPEIKAISAKLMELDWINGYSLNSTSPEWRSPGPHYYVEDVWGVEYADLGFFDHPYEPIGVEYFMMVNREGIADMTNRTVSVALDAQHWPEEDTLILTDIANADNPRYLVRQSNSFTYSDTFEPGEGKLYRVMPR